MLRTLKLQQDLKPRQFELSNANGGHPNKIPFKCSLFEVDKVSDGSPEGATGKRIRISSAVCDSYLQTFVGMAFNIDYHNGMRGHDSRFKVGVIEKATRTMDGFAMVEGYIFGKDFADVVASIRYYNGLADEYDMSEYRFGASLEMEAAVMTASDDADVLDVTEFCGTGGAILFADDAAFKNTSFAAKNTKEVVEMTPEQLKEMQESMKSLTESMTSLSASVQTVTKEVGSVKTEFETLKAAKTEAETKAAEEAAKAELKASQDKTAALEAKVAELEAAAKREPERKTLNASQLLSKFGNTEEINDLATFSASVDKLNLPVAESLKLKMQARAQLKDGE